MVLSTPRFVSVQVDLPDGVKPQPPPPGLKAGPGLLSQKELMAERMESESEGEREGPSGRVVPFPSLNLLFPKT